jgi:ParB family chromosome partitioning protein
MSERKSRFGDRSALPADPALQVLQLRPRGVASDPAAPITYPGRLAAEDQQGLVARLQKARDETAAVQDELRVEREAREHELENGMVLLRLDPKQIALTQFANRHANALKANNPKMVKFKEGLRRRGQDTPVRVRPSPAGSILPYELVEGHRRLAAILALDQESEGGFQILARLDAKAAEAKDLVLKMYRENADREDLSAFETGSMFRQWLTAKVYDSQREIAAATDLHESTVGQYIAIAELPAEVLAAFADVLDISARWSPALVRICREQPAEVLARARRIAKQNPRPDAEAVFKALTAGSAPRPKRRGSKLSESVKVDNKVLFTIALKDGRFSINPKQIDPEGLPELYEDLKAYAHKWLKNHKRTKP